VACTCNSKSEDDGGYTGWKDAVLWTNALAVKRLVKVVYGFEVNLILLLLHLRKRVLTDRMVDVTTWQLKCYRQQQRADRYYEKAVMAI